MWLGSMAGTREGDRSLWEGSAKGEAFVGGSKLLALLGCLTILLLGVLCFASLKELPHLLGLCKPFVHPLKTRTLETNYVWEQVKLPICVLKILISFLIRMKSATQELAGSKIFVFQILSLLRNFPERCVEVISVMKHTFVFVHIWITCNYPIHQFLLSQDKRDLIQVF